MALREKNLLNKYIDATDKSKVLNEIKAIVGDEVGVKGRKKNVEEVIDISSRNVSNIEQGISFPKPETLEKIVKSFGITTDKLFTADHIKTKKELLDNINQYIDKIKNNEKMLEIVYKILRDLIEV